MERDRRRRTLTAESITELYGKIPPQALEIEAAILGAALLESRCIPEITALLTHESFYREQNQVIYQSIIDLYDAGRVVDLLTVAEALKSKNELDAAGGPVYLVSLTDRIASSANVTEHCRILQERQIKREIIRAASEAFTEAYDDSTDPFDCLANLERGAATANEIVTKGGNMRPLAGVLGEVTTEAARREAQFKAGRCTGIPTGIAKLDRVTSGWQKGDLVILAGRPSMGKTALMLHHALASGVNVCVYSLEMSDVSLANRLVLSASNIDPYKFRTGAMSPHDWTDFNAAVAKLEAMPIYIDHNPTASTRYIKSHSKLMKDKGKCDLIMVDYLQLVDMRSDQHGRNREQEVSQAAREFKVIAKSLDIPVILLSQLSRECEKRGDKRPMLSDLRESGAIEQDADVVIFAYRPAYYGITGANGEAQDGLGYEIIAKGRNIGTSDVPFRHNESMTKIWDYDVNESEYASDEQLTPF